MSDVEDLLNPLGDYDGVLVRLGYRRVEKMYLKTFGWNLFVVYWKGESIFWENQFRGLDGVIRVWEQRQVAPVSEYWLIDAIKGSEELAHLVRAECKSSFEDLFTSKK